MTVILWLPIVTSKFVSALHHSQFISKLYLEPIYEDNLYYFSQPQLTRTLINQKLPTKEIRK